MPANTSAIRIFRVLVSLMLFLTVNAHAKPATINSVTVEIAANTATIAINGTQLCVEDKKQANTCKSIPIVTLAGLTTSLVSSTPSQIVTTSPVTEAGTYTLRLNNGQGKSYISYGLTIAGLNMPGRGDLNATVTSCSGTPVSAAAYIPGLSVGGYTDENGSISLNNIPSGNRNLVVERKAEAAINTTQPIDISAGQVTNAGTIILDNLQTDVQNCGACNNSCQNGYSCTFGQCTPPPPSCIDGLKNGNETDKDCGGICQSCNVSQHCAVDSDCMSNLCVDTYCTVP